MGAKCLVGAKKDEIWDWNRCACHCLNIPVQAALKQRIIEDYLAPLTTLPYKFSERECRESVQEDVDGNTKSG